MFITEKQPVSRPKVVTGIINEDNNSAHITGWETIA